MKNQNNVIIIDNLKKNNFYQYILDNLKLIYFYLYSYIII